MAIQTNRRLVFALLCVSSLAWSADAVDPKLYLDDIKYLASPELRGRATGSPELEKAAHFIAGKFRQFGLKPPDGKNYYQAFSVTTDARLGKSNRWQFTDASGHVTELRSGEDFIPFKFSSAGKISGQVVFAGYGITAPDYHYDDYAGLDVKDKIVLILRHEPQEFDEHSVFAGKEFSTHAAFSSKASNAKMHGAAAVILINDRANHKHDSDELEKFSNAAGPADAGIPFVQVKEEKIDAWFTAAGRPLDSIAAAIDKDLKPESFAIPGVRVEGQVDIERAVKTVHNVAGYLPGQSDEYIIIGAHYDHLGLGEQYSMAPKLAGTVHPGADDNASGTAGVIELARWFSKQPQQKRGILFLTFAGEEQGLLGSAFYVGHPELPLEKAAAMINMDMIGRVREGKVYIGGSATGTDLRAMLDRITPKHHLNIDYSDTSGYGASDHTSFTTGHVPVLFFFSGLHSDYHKPSDTWDKIDAPGAAKLLDLVADVAEELRETPARPQYVRVAPPQGHGTGSAGPVSGSSGSGYGPYFGSVPDFGEGTKGVKFSDVREGSPAAKAGLKAGDIMVEWDGKPIENLYDFTYALRAKKPGDTVRVKVLREGKPVEANVLLTKRD